MAHCIRIRIHAGGRVEDDARRAGLITGLITGLSVGIAPLAPLSRHFLKHAIDCADVKVHMLIEAGAKPVDEDRACLFSELAAGWGYVPPPVSPARSSGLLLDLAAARPPSLLLGNTGYGFFGLVFASDFPMDFGALFATDGR